MAKRKKKEQWTDMITGKKATKKQVKWAEEMCKLLGLNKKKKKGYKQANRKPKKLSKKDLERINKANKLLGWNTDEK